MGYRPALFLVLLLCVASAACVCAAADGPVVAQEDMTARIQSWRYFDHRDGLVDGRIRSVYRAADGAMWFAGQNGVSRYDGIAWTTYSSETLGIAGTNAILQTKDGSIWVGANDGLARLREGRWTTFKQIDGLDRPTVTTLCEDSSGILWAGFGQFEWQQEVSERGLARWDGTAWQRAPEEKGWRNRHVNDVYEGPGGLIWVATDAGVSRFDGRSWITFAREDGLPRTGVQTTLEEEDGTVWFGTGDGLTRLKDGKWTTFSVAEEDVEHAVDSMYRTSDGTIWTYSGSTLSRFDGTRLSVCRIPVRGPSSRVYAKMYGEGDVLWLAGWPGVVRLDYGGREWTSFRGIGDAVKAPDGRLWFRKGAGAVLFDGISWKDAPGVGWPVYLREDGSVWCGGAGGIHVLDTGTRRSYPGILDSLYAITGTRDGRIVATGRFQGQNRVALFAGGVWKAYSEKDWGEGIRLGRKVVEMPGGDLWFLPELAGVQAGYGLVKFDGEQWAHYTAGGILGNKELDGSLLNRVYDLAVDTAGRVWAGAGGGIWCFDGQDWQVFLTPDGEPGLSGPRIRRVGLAGMKVTRVMVAADSSVLFACGATRGGGISRFHNEVWTAYTVSDGLVSNDVWEIMQARDGALWFGTSAGVSRYDGRLWTNFTHEDLLFNNDVRQILQDDRGAIWFGGKTRLGESWVTRYRADTLAPETSLSFTPGEELPSGNLILEWTGRDAWDDTPVEELLYSWQMDGGGWSADSPEVKGVFAGLASGDHVFRVRARDKDGNVDPAPAAFRFYVIPPVWKQPWFIGLMAALAGIIGYQASRLVVVNRKLRVSNDALSSINRDLIQENAALAQIVRTTEVCVVAAGTDGHISFANKALRTTFSYPAKELVGRPWQMLLQRGVQPADEVEEIVRATLAGKWRGEVICRRGDGSEFPAFLLTSVIRNTEGRPTGVVGLMRDITEEKQRAEARRQLERQVVRSERMASVGTVAAGIVHNLRNPLTIIIGYSELLRKMHPEESEVDRIRSSAAQMQEMIEDVLNKSRKTKKVEPVDMNALLQRELDFLQADLVFKHQVTTELDLAEDLPLVRCVYTDFSQVFGNLLRNAVDAMYGRQEKRLSVSTAFDDEAVVVAIEDTGCGIEEEHLPHLFDPFFTTKFGDGDEDGPVGTGLGLYTVQQILEPYDARLELESTVGVGTTFRVRIPRR